MNYDYIVYQRILNGIRTPSYTYFSHGSFGCSQDVGDGDLPLLEPGTGTIATTPCVSRTQTRCDSVCECV